MSYLNDLPVLYFYSNTNNTEPLELKIFVTNRSYLEEADLAYVVENNLGVRKQELVPAIIFTILYVLVFLTGFVGNCCVCGVFIRNRYMRTNLNTFLLNLAVSDLISLIVGEY